MSIFKPLDLRVLRVRLPFFLARKWSIPIDLRTIFLFLVILILLRTLFFILFDFLVLTRFVNLNNEAPSCVAGRRSNLVVRIQHLQKVL